MDWVKLQTLYDSEKKALETANVVAATEARLANQKHGPQYEIETRVEPVGDKWQVFWRKVLIETNNGCGGGCQSCSPKLPSKNKAKVLPFRKP